MSIQGSDESISTIKTQDIDTRGFMSVKQLAHLEALLKTLKSSSRASPEKEAFGSSKDMMFYSWKLYKDKINQDNVLLADYHDP